MLYVVATPIGCSADLSHRALKLLKEATFIIGEEKKEVTRLLKQWEATGKPIDLLNEHSDKSDIRFLTEECAKHEVVVLISDCGTPGFCDPGADLVASCRKAGIAVKPVPGPSSLMALLSVCGHRVENFHFRGFLPAKGERRIDAIGALSEIDVPTILMDTPYRLERTLDEISKSAGQQKIILGLNLTQENEKVEIGLAGELLENHIGEKSEFILMIFPKKEFAITRSGRSKQATKRNKTINSRRRTRR